ncbi:MAG: 50S ribosomal protein L18 [bacterium]|nr:50S ribosomal protein L18 [bacterium]
MKPTYALKFRRKREGRTNYKKRLKLLLSNKPRIVIRKSLKNMNAQIAIYEPNGDKIVASANSAELKKYGWNFSGGNIAAAYLTGILLAVKAKKTNVKDGVVDIGFTPSVMGSRTYATLKGIIDAGNIQVACSEKVFPKDERIKGAHISTYAKALEGQKERFEKQFSKYIKAGANPKALDADFEKTKNSILKENGKTEKSKN